MPGADPPIRVENIDHVTLVVKDLDRTRDFYVGVLGMEEVPRPAFSFPGSWYQAGNTQIHVILEHKESGPAGNSDLAELIKTRTHHIAFRVEDATEAAQLFEENGIELISGPAPRPDGPIQVFLSDPDGHVIEVTSPV